MGFLSKLFETHSDKGRANEMVERIMVLQPHLRLAKNYRGRLSPAVEISLKYLDSLIGSLPPSREASSTAWASDPYIRAYFTNADDVAEVISRSTDLRTLFENYPDLQEAYGVLGMEMIERHILGTEVIGETLRRDVQQTTVGFTDHQVRMCGRDQAELQKGVIERLIDQLALEGLAQIAEDKSRRNMLQKECALLKTRLQLLERQGTGIRSVFGKGASEESSDRLAELHAEIEGNERSLASLGLQTDALDNELTHVRDVLAEPSRHIYLSSRCIKLTRMNVVIEESSAQAGDEIELHFARIPTEPPRMRAFSLIRFKRSDLLPAKSLLDEATRILASGILS
jgi:hypothetical protein